MFDLIKADHKVLSEGCESRNNHQYAVVVQYLPPGGYSRIRAQQELLRKHKGACKSSWSRIGSLKSFTLTILWNLAKPVKIFPGIIVREHHTDRKNGIVERAVRNGIVDRIKEGTSAVLLQSGLNANWWAASMECFSYLRNIQDLLSDGETPCKRRFEEPVKGPIIPFGSLVEYYSISARDQSRIHQFGKKVLLGLFLGYALYSGGTWKGDIMVADLEELETMDAPEIYSKRFNAKEAIFPKQNGKFIFPAADGRIKFVGGDGQGDGVPKVGLQQAAADSRGSRTCVSAKTPIHEGWHAQWRRMN